LFHTNKSLLNFTEIQLGPMKKYNTHYWRENNNKCV